MIYLELTHKGNCIYNGLNHLKQKLNIIFDENPEPSNVMFYKTGIIITFFLAFILISKKEKSFADKILASWLVILGVHLALFYLNFSGHYKSFPYFLGIEIPFPFLQGPLLYLYTKALTSSKPWHNKYLLHFVPFALTYFLLLPFFGLSFAEKITVYNNKGQGFESLMAIITWAVFLSGVVYPILAYRKLMRHKKDIRDQFSDTEKINLNWLQYLILGMSLIWLAVIFAEEGTTFNIVVVYIIFIGYFGIKQVGIFTNRPQPIESLLPHSQTGKKDVEADGAEAVLEKVKYEKSVLTDKELQLIHSSLCEVMETEKLYLDPELNLSQLAARLDVHPNILSQVINTKEANNFYDYVNLYRIGEFKKTVLLPENKKYTILSMAYACGFNSKTSFNRNFKKVTGFSPSEYLRNSSIPV